MTSNKLKFMSGKAVFVIFAVNGFTGGKTVFIYFQIKNRYLIYFPQEAVIGIWGQIERKAVLATARAPMTGKRKSSLGRKTSYFLRSANNLLTFLCQKPTQGGGYPTSLRYLFYRVENFSRFFRTIFDVYDTVKVGVYAQGVYSDKGKNWWAYIPGGVYSEGILSPNGDCDIIKYIHMKQIL